MQWSFHTAYFFMLYKCRDLKQKYNNIFKINFTTIKILEKNHRIHCF